MQPWIQTYSGKVFDLSDPYNQEFDIEDIAWALSQQCRYSGHTKRFYSVAEHSYWCAQVALRLDPKRAFEALMHDAHEAYVSDVAAPVKTLLPDYCKWEATVASAVRLRYELPEVLPKLIEEIDFNMMCTERQQLLVWPPPRDWVDMDNGGYLFLGLHCWSPEMARKNFLAQFNGLCPKGMRMSVQDDDEDNY